MTSFQRVLEIMFGPVTRKYNIRRGRVDAAIGEKTAEAVAAKLEPRFDALAERFRDQPNTTPHDFVKTIKDGFQSDIERFMVFSVALRLYDSQERRDSSFDVNLGVLFAALIVFYIEAFKWAREGPHAWALWPVFWFCLVSLTFVGIPLFAFRATPEPKALSTSSALIKDMTTGNRGSVQQIVAGIEHERATLAAQSRLERLATAFKRRRGLEALFPVLGAAGALANETEFIGQGTSSKRLGARLAIGLTVALALVLWLPVVLQSPTEQRNAIVELSDRPADLHRGSYYRQPEQYDPRDPTGFAALSRPCVPNAVAVRPSPHPPYRALPRCPIK